MTKAATPNAPARRGIGLVGATTMVGIEIKERLAADGYGSLVDLLALEDGIGVFTEYGDEARVVMEIAEQDIRERAVVCFCGAPEAAATYAEEVAAEGGVAIDCTGVLRMRGNSHPATFHLGGLATEAAKPTLIATPSGGALLLAELHGVLGERLAGASATVLLPASEHSDAAAEELARQTASILNFMEDTDDSAVDESGPFGRRLAFDAWLAPEGRSDLMGELVAMGIEGVAAVAVQASIFHSVAASVHMPGCDHNALAELLSTVSLPSQNQHGQAIDSPATAAGNRELYIGGLRSDGAGGSWLWSLLDNHHAVATAAVAAIAAHVPPPFKAGDADSVVN